MFRGFLLGDCGRPQPSPGLGGTIDRSFATRPLDRNEGRAIKDPGESGEESGVICSSAVSTVDIVVVGEELFDEEAEVETLLCDLCIEFCSNVIPGAGAN